MTRDKLSCSLFTWANTIFLSQRDDRYNVMRRCFTAERRVAKHWISCIWIMTSGVTIEGGRIATKAHLLRNLRKKPGLTKNETKCVSNIFSSKNTFCIKWDWSGCMRCVGAQNESTQNLIFRVSRLGYAIAADFMHNRTIYHIPTKLCTKELWSLRYSSWNLYTIAKIFPIYRTQACKLLLLFSGASNSKEKPHSSFSIASPQISKGREKQVPFAFSRKVQIRKKKRKNKTEARYYYWQLSEIARTVRQKWILAVSK